MTAGTSSGFQEQLWRGEFGDAYVDRNTADDSRLASRTTMWVEIFKRLAGDPPHSILEVGANIGLNLRAIRRLTSAKLLALEPNAKARKILVDEGVAEQKNVLDGLSTNIALPDGAADLVFTSGVLIHIHPDQLLKSCAEIHRTSRRYIACIEYFSDKPVELDDYRGNANALFKRDFGGFYLDNFPDLRVIDYGFCWKRVMDMDNLTWWLFEKRPK